MSTSVSLNGTTFTIPRTGDDSWSATGGVDDYLVALATGVLTRAGGTFTLTAEVNTGATYGFKTAYYKSQGAIPATAGVVRLANLESVSWRNAANSADLSLAVNASNVLQFGGTSIPLSGAIVNADISPSAAIAYSKLALTGAILNADLAGSIAYAKLVLAGSVVNADISAAAAITYSKLSLTGAILNADLAGSIAYSKLSLSGSIVNADISAAAAIGYSKLALTGAILNADLAGSIAYSKLVLAGSVLNSDLAGSIAYAKLLLTGSVVNADIGAAAAIAYSKLNLAGGVVNADIGAAAAIAYSKLALSSSIATGDLAAGMLVPIAKGGTGQTTANTALNAFLPTQTSNANKVLQTDGTNTLWATVATTAVATPTGAGLVTSYYGTIQSSVNNLASANYTVTTTDNYRTILVTTGAADRTITLPSAGTNAGRVLTIKKADTGAGKVLIARSGTDTIEGVTTLTVPNQYDSVTLVCDGSSTWQVAAFSGASQTRGSNGGATSPAAGYVGEYKENVRTVTPNAATNGTATEIDSGGTGGSATGITLGAGIWDISGAANFSGNAATTTTLLEAFIGTQTGNVFTGRDLQRNTTAISYPSFTLNNLTILTLPVWRVNVTTQTVYYLKGLALFGGGSIDLTGTIRATRVA